MGGGLEIKLNYVYFFSSLGPQKVDLFISKLVKLFSPREKRRDGSENVYTVEADRERLHGGD